MIDGNFELAASDDDYRFAVVAEYDDHTEISIYDILLSPGQSDFAASFL